MSKPSREQVRANNARRRFSQYGITEHDYNDMRKLQNNCCAICSRETALVIDHCHKTRTVRGLLCGHCNRAIGFMSDSVETLERAIAYLSRQVPIFIPTWRPKDKDGRSSRPKLHSVKLIVELDTCCAKNFARIKEQLEQKAGNRLTKSAALRFIVIEAAKERGIA